jgi:hypothetical protein
MTGTEIICLDQTTIALSVEAGERFHHTWFLVVSFPTSKLPSSESLFPKLSSFTMLGGLIGSPFAEQLQDSNNSDKELILLILDCCSLILLVTELVLEIQYRMQRDISEFRKGR